MLKRHLQFQSLKFTTFKNDEYKNNENTYIIFPFHIHCNWSK